MVKKDNKITETLILQDCRSETEEIKEFLKDLNQNQKKEFMAFIQGAKLMHMTLKDRT